MRTHPGRVGRAAITAALLCALLAQAGPAAGAGREFRGEIVRVSEKGLVVENRMGDERRFRRTGASRVEGRSGWNALAKGDRVIVEYVREGERQEVTRVIVLGGGR